MAYYVQTLLAVSEGCACERCEGYDNEEGFPCECGQFRYTCRYAPCSCESEEHPCCCGEPISNPEQELCKTCWLADFYRHYYAAFRLQKAWRQHKQLTHAS